jgi:hypothetical protein
MAHTHVLGANAPPGSGAQRCALAGERERLTNNTAGPARTPAARLSPMVSVYDIRTCIGFIKHVNGAFLALDPDRNVIGTFATMRDAARACPGGRS